MPPPNKSIPWDTIRSAYIQGQGSIKALASRFDINPYTVASHARKHQWGQSKSQIKENTELAVSRVGQSVTERVAQKSADLVAAHLEKVLLSGDGILSKIGAKLEAAIVPDINRLDHLELATRVYGKWDDLVRRAHGLPDSPQQVDITSGGLSAHANALAVLETCRRLVADGKASKDIDVEGLVEQMQLEDGKPGASEADSSISTGEHGSL